MLAPRMVWWWRPWDSWGSGKQPLFLTNWSRFGNFFVVQFLALMDKVKTLIESGLDHQLIFRKNSDWLVVRQLVDGALITDSEVAGNNPLFTNRKDSGQVIHRPEWPMGVKWMPWLYRKPRIVFG